MVKQLLRSGGKIARIVLLSVIVLPLLSGCSGFYDAYIIDPTAPTEEPRD